MTQSIFNLYSANVFAEHPKGLWALDEDLSFLSLVSGSPSWSITNGVSASVSNPPPTKPEETVGIGTIELELQSFTGSASVMTLETQTFSVPADVDLGKPTVCIHSFIYPYDAQITNLEIGFETASVRYSTTYTNLSQEEWYRVFHTMDLPESGSVQPFIEITFADTERTISLYKFSVGQWSEQYNHQSTGVIPIPLSSLSASAALQSAIGGEFINNPGNIKIVEADNYGFAKDGEGYYIVESNKMLALNSKLPMVFGSGDITEIKASPTGGPSIVFPGKGFFHQNGKFQDITAEFWLRINPNVQSKKIFGPVSSEDGLYVEDKYLTLKLGPYEKSYFIHKWYRPMLVAIRYTPLFVSVLINGDVVIQQEILPRNLELPDSFSFNDDWVAFYGDDNIPQFEVDCLAIYPYAIAEQAAKRKFVYGQGVGPAEEVTKKFGGDSFSVEFPFAEYTKNIIYPDMTKWFAGFYSNINADSKFISLPQYPSAEFSYVGDDLTPFNLDRSRRTWGGLKNTSIWSTWLASTWRRISQSREIDPEYDNYFLQTEGSTKTFVKLKPSPGYANLFGSLTLGSMNPITEPVSSILGIFSINNSELNETTETQMMLMHFKNNASGNVFQIVLNKTTSKIQYLHNTTVIKEQDFTFTSADKEFVVGIKIDSLTKSYATLLRNFFSNQQNIKLNIGGVDRNTFPGKIYRVIFNNNFFTRKDMLARYSSDGLAIYNNSSIDQSLFDYIGNYTILFNKTNESVLIDVGVSGYWEDSIPFSSFAAFVENTKGSRVLYDVDILQFNIDYPAPITSQANFDTEDKVKAFVSIQSFEDVGGISYLNYTNTKGLDGNRFVNFDTATTNINTTKFRVVDGTVIFPPKQIISFARAYLTIHVEMKSAGVHTKPIQIQRMSLASLAFDESKLYALSSPTGRKIYPFTRQGGTYSSKTKNPFLIQKETATYLYLTGDSGIQAVPYPEIEDFASSNFFRGFSIPINQSKKQDFELYGVHSWMFYNRSQTISSRQLVFSLSYENKKYNFYLEPEIQNKRAKIVAYEKTITSEEQVDDFDIFQNGVKQEVYIYPQSWSLVTIKPKFSINLDGIVGQFEISPGVLIKNFTAYESVIKQRVDDIFEAHLGLSNIVAQDNSTLTINSEGLTVFSDIKWGEFSGKPV